MVGVLFVLALVGCVLIGTKAHDPLTLLKESLKDENISCEKKVEMLRGFEDEKAMIYSTRSVDITVGKIVEHCKESIDQCQPSRMIGGDLVLHLYSRPELKEIAEYCTSSLKRICRDKIDQLGNEIVERMGDGADLMSSILKSYEKLEQETDSEAQRQENVLLAIDEVSGGAQGDDLNDFGSRLKEACSESRYMFSLFNSMAEEGGKKPEVKGSSLVTNWYKVGTIAAIVAQLEENDFARDLSENAYELYGKLQEILLY